ncbi:hypothetical protein [Haloechinothrix sp. LS1_15]|uniref:hypothetical protein n=1 Tax=Haloechinothrix sp. LS1_15 TaxID=2652248 RepID=UPI0029475A01|nr:hypothetical protein [Haloechinothrix sp. LS1_15]MDV6014728.1 hypothetical protein [Haloechinothrix sp. LS1_15]
MSTTLPVPMEFTLPEGWQSVPPDEAGSPGVALVAMHPASSEGFTANITVAGELRPDEASMATIADEAIVRLRQGASVELQDRTEVGDEDAPGLTQLVRLATTVNDQQLDLVQSHVFLGILDSEDPRKRAVIQLTLTATPGQFDTVVGDFQQFVRTARPAG